MVPTGGAARSNDSELGLTLMTQGLRAECERTFRRYGLPLLVDDHSARRDVFGRAAPFLLLVLMFEVAAAARLTWPWWLNTLAIIAVTLGLCGAYALVNLMRSRPWHTLPQDVGTVELAFFVLAPGLLVFLTGGQWEAGLILVAFNLFVLGAVFATVRYGLGATLWWGASRLGSELGSSLLRLVRFLPLLLIFSMALFYSSEVWQLFGQAPATSTVVLSIFFAILILLILALRLRTETRQVLKQAEEATPGAKDLPRLTRAQLHNVSAMVASNQLLQVVVVSAGVGLFFFAIGILTITPGLMDSWGVQVNGWSQDISLWGESLIITQTHLRVAGAMAMFTGLYYAVSVLTDAIYREDFIGDIAAKLTEVNTYRVKYHALLGQSEQSRDTIEP